MCIQVPSEALAGTCLGERNHGDVGLHDNSKAHVNTTGAEASAGSQKGTRPDPQLAISRCDLI